MSSTAVGSPRAKNAAALPRLRNREEPVEILQQNFEVVVELLKSSEGENTRLNDRLNLAALERAAIARTWRLSLRTMEDELATLSQRCLLLEERAAASLDVQTSMLAQARQETQHVREELLAAEAKAAAAAAAATAATASEARALEAAAAARVGMERGAEELRDARSALEAQLSAAKVEAKEQVERSAAEQRQASDAAGREELARDKMWSRLCSEMDGEIDRLLVTARTVSGCEARALAAERAADELREESRRVVGAERQRVAGMLYKEALQSHTLEEQAKQLESLNDRLAEAQQAKRERIEAVEAQKAMEEQMQALADSKSKHVQSMLALDEQLAQEQQLRVEQDQIVQTLQAALTDRATREASTSERARRAEESLEALKKSYREVRQQLGKALTSAEKARTDLRSAEAARRAIAGSHPCASVQTEWVSMILPLPTPKGMQQ